MDEPLDAWFKREILQHEDMLMRFLTRVWPRRDERDDIRQEAYARVYQAARQVRPSAPKAFLFATARHLMADRIRHDRVVSITAGGEKDYLDVLVDEISPERRVSAHEELTRLARAFDRLPAKCREVVWQRRVRGLSQKEISAKLGLKEKTVEKHLTTGVKLLTRHMRTAALIPRLARHVQEDTDTSVRDHEQEHD